MITENYASFFKSLAKNNRKEWFHANKQAYENEVKKPFLALVETLIPKLQSLDANISSNPKDALFRINRDIRFSKDKTPYNTLMKASFAPGGKRSTLPGFYLGMGANTLHLGGGLINLKGPALRAIRTAIAQHTEEFIKIVEAKSFIKKYDQLKGEQSKRIDKEFKSILEKTPLIAHKQFYVMCELPLKEYLNSDQLPPTIMEYFEACQPLNQFLKQSLSIKS